MISYTTGIWGIGFIFRCHGSVFPKAACWALPNAALAFMLHYYLHAEDESTPNWMGGVGVLFSSWSAALAFLVVFRNNLAQDRFWEGATLISQVRGNWFNAVSSLVAFSSKDPNKADCVLRFQHLLVRLSSMLYCAALQQICDLRDDTMEIIDPRGMSDVSIAFLQSTNDRCEVMLQWIQQLIVDAGRNEVVDVAPPILSRVFQELSNGIVALNNVRKIHDIPFPFPYAQMITCMFVLQWFFTPFFAAYAIDNREAASLMCFLYTCTYACLIYIPNEIDQPFGSDANDLPLAEMQRDYNTSLLNLLNPLVQHPPEFEFDKDRKTVVVESGRGLTSRKTIKDSGSTTSIFSDGSPMSPIRQSVAGVWKSLSITSNGRTSNSETDGEYSSEDSRQNDILSHPPSPNRLCKVPQQSCAGASGQAPFRVEIWDQDTENQLICKPQQSNRKGPAPAEIRDISKASTCESASEASSKFDHDLAAALEKVRGEIQISPIHGDVLSQRVTAHTPPMTPNDPPMTRLRLS